MISDRTLPSRPLAAERAVTLPLGRFWHLAALAVIVIISGVLNFVGLSKEGYDNEFYAAAVKSMSESWHNFFFNSFDPGGFVTIDKPPLGFWFQVASVKLFGFSGVSLLIPEALAGVLSVALLYRLVSRSFGNVAGLIAALALAVTPISVVTNRNNTIDSILVLFVLLAAWAVFRAVETGKLRWLLVCAVLVGLGFNIKMLEAYLVVPAFGLVYLMGTRKALWRKVLHLAAAAGILLAVSLSWVTAVDLTPAGQRPWVDSTTTNSALDLAVGYNGLQRLTGNHAVGSSGGSARTSPAATTKSTGAPRTAARGASGATGTGGFGGAAGPGGNGGPGGVGENGPTGPLRLLDTQLGSQIGWLLPLALLGVLFGLWSNRSGFRTLNDRQLSVVLWGTWLLTTGAFFSVALFFHTYYLVMTAPAVSALAGIAVVSLWRDYRRPGSKTWWLLPLGLLIAAAVQVHILTSYPAWAQWLTPLTVGGTLLAAFALVAAHIRLFQAVHLAAGALAIAVVALLMPASAFAAYTMQHTQTGSILRAGPSATGTSTGPGGFGGQGGPPAGATFRQSGSTGSQTGAQSGPPPGQANAPSGPPGPPPGGNGTATRPGAAGFGPPPGMTATSVRGNGRFGGPGGAKVSARLISYLVKHRGTATYLVATPSSNDAAPIIIATGDPVMSLGGFTGSDPILTASRLASLARRGEVRYFLLGGGGGQGGNNTLTSWIQHHSRMISVGGTQLYQYTG